MSESKWPPSCKSRKTSTKDGDELQSLIDEIINLSIDVVDDYNKNPSEISGSVVRIHENSEFLSSSIDDS